MFRQLEDFYKDWAYEMEATGKVMSALTDASLAQRITPEGRSLGELAWHIAETPSEMMTQAGLPIQVTHEGQEIPASAAEIAATYAKAAQAVVDQLKVHWTDAMLLDEVPMYGESWTRGTVLDALMGHQNHHRGQMTVLMRQAGLTVPGVYGPAKEEWAAYGMPAPR